jgi:hypothetical protein
VTGARARGREQPKIRGTPLLPAQVCDFKGQWVYFLCGWEGSASDSAIFAKAQRLDFSIPPGCFYLGDAGFPLCNTVLVPYRGVRYHLREWMVTGLR